ncbi:hypothetical protein HAX54_018370, partial [Datura stramonium]|nr:hypothetical protein [Datura stramonium]
PSLSRSLDHCHDLGTVKHVPLQRYCLAVARLSCTFNISLTLYKQYIITNLH